MNTIFDFPQFVEIRRGPFKWFAPVQEAWNEYIRIDNQGLPEEVPNIYNFEKEENTIPSELNIFKSYTSTNVRLRIYRNAEYVIYVTNL